MVSETCVGEIHSPWSGGNGVEECPHCDVLNLSLAHLNVSKVPLCYGIFQTPKLVCDICMCCGKCTVLLAQRGWMWRSS